MTQTDKNPLQVELEEIENAANERVEKLAYEYLESTIKPFCDKYNLWFTSGWGMFNFHSEKNNLYFYDANDLLDVNVTDLVDIDEDDLHPTEKLVIKYPSIGIEMKEIFDDLNVVVFDSEFGFNVPCYKP